MMASKRPRISSGGGGGAINDDGADGAALAKNVAPVPASISGSSSSTAASSTAASTATTTAPLPHGTFTGRSIFRNRIGPKETVALGHISLQHLIPHSTQKCLCTTFISAGARWMEDTFGSRVTELLVVRHDSRTVHVTQSGGTGGQKKVGDAILEPIEVIENNTDHGSDGGDGDSDSDDDSIVVSKPNWHWLRARPASGGILHAKILLFRTQDGLRVVVTGSNLCDQWVGDRDVLWVQDFDVLPQSSRKRSRKQQPSMMYLTNPTAQRPPRFEKCLREFVMDITQCRNSGKDDAYVRKYVTELFDGVDFETAQAELVYSFPRERGSTVDTGRLQGGWPMLAKVVSRLKEQHENDGYNTDDDEGDVDEEDTMVYVAAGCHGNLTPSFLLQMHRAMNGNTRGVRPDLSWDKAPRGLKVLWPSTRVALTLLPTGVINTGGPMSLKHWRTIPLEAKRRLLLEARSNTPVSGLAFPDLGCDPALHGKCIIATPRTALAWNPSILYVGSHNFSSAAFGDANGTADGTRPKNIELGVVLASTDRKTIAEWKERLPYVIPSSDKRPLDDGYIPMTANSGIKAEWNDAYRAGDMEGRRRAEAKLREWLQRVEVGGDGDGLKLEDNVKSEGDSKPAMAKKPHRLLEEEDGNEAKGENERSRSNQPRAAEVVDLLMSDSDYM